MLVTAAEAQLKLVAPRAVTLQNVGLAGDCETWHSAHFQFVVQGAVKPDDVKKIAVIAETKQFPAEITKQFPAEIVVIAETKQTKQFPAAKQFPAEIAESNQTVSRRNNRISPCVLSFFV